MNIGNIGKIFGGIFGGSKSNSSSAGQAGPQDTVASAMKVDSGTYTRLMSSLSQVQSAAPVSANRPPLDIKNQNFGVEVEVAAPKGLDTPNPPPTPAMVESLIKKGYKFTVDGYIVKQEAGKVIEGGNAITDGKQLLEIAAKNPERIIATDPHTGEHHGFQDTQDQKVNSQYFLKYVKFKTFMEDKVRPAMDKIGWIAEDTVTCQAHAGVGETTRYIEVKNQISTINKGGGEDLKKALEFLKEIGCSVHEACALQFHLDMRQFSPEEAKRVMQNLVRENLENENIIYRLAQNGTPQHRGVANNFAFCRPLSSEPITPFLHAENAGDLKQLWYGELFPGGEFKEDPVERPSGPYHNSRYYALNVHSYWYRGSVEMRTPATTLDPDTASAHLDLALGMLAAAYNPDKYEWKGVHTLGFEPEKSDPKTFQVANDAPVDADQMTRFLDRTVGDNKASRQKLLDIFFKSGGTINEKPVNDTAVAKADQLIKGGYQFIAHVPDLDNKQHVASDGVEAVEGARKLHCNIEVKGPNEAQGKLFTDAGALTEYLVSR